MSKNLDTKYIKEVKPGTYRISIRTGKTIDGKNLYITKQKKNITLSEAKRIRDEMLKEKYSLEDLDGNIKFIDFARSYLKDHAFRTHTGTTLDCEASKIRNHIIPYLGNYKMKDISPVIIQKLINYLLEKDSKKRSSSGEIVKLSPVTVRNVYNILCAIFHKAVQLKVIKETPCTGITLEKCKKYHPTVYTIEDMNNLIKCLLSSNLPIQKKCIFILAMSTGMRRGELCGILTENIDFDRKVIKVKKSLSSTKSKGTELKLPKTESGIREVGLNDISIQLIKEHLENQERMKELLGNKWENSPTLFTSETGGFVSLNSITSSWIRFIKSNNLKPIPLKGLRTSFATYLAYNNYPPKVVQSLLGHSSERTTMQFYEFAYDDYATSILETTNNIGSGIKNEKN